MKLSLKRRKRSSMRTLLRKKRRIRSPSEKITSTLIPTKYESEVGSVSSPGLNNTHELTSKPNCMHPEYVVYTWVLSMIALATALKLYYLIKLLLAILMVALYTTLIILPSNHIFNEMPGSKREPE